jgi:polyisoprenyl-teichoic acid--peptidoglycan teichoic acid transferase
MAVNRKKIRRKKKRSLGRSLLFLVGIGGAIVLVILAASMITFFTGLKSGLTPSEGENIPKPLAGERINILVLGVDVPLDSKGNVNYSIPTRTDTMMLATLDVNDGSISVLSVPRDTRTQIPGRTGFYKINSAHVYGGPGLSVQTVSKFLDVPIHYYVRTNIEGFSKIVDILGGIEIEVEKDMHYVDIYQDLVIDLKEGKQILNGDKAMQFVRYRGDGSDIRRIGRQQQFLSAVANEFLHPSTLFKLPRLAGEIVKHLDTNMQAVEMVKLARLVVKSDPSAIEMNVVPGSGRTIGGASYWVADMEKTQEIIDKQVWNIDREKNASIKIEVFNGTETRGLATTVAKMLEGKGFNVVRIANADELNHTETKVVAYSSDDAKMTAFRRVFSSGTLYYEVGNNEADIAVIIGKDFIQ